MRFRGKQFSWLLWILAAAIAVDFALMWLNPVPCPDVAERYAPMAEAFSRGDFDFAFHPRFGLFFPVLSGTICHLTGWNGFRACQLAALLLFWLSVFPLWGIFKRVWDEETALLGCAMYLCCSHLLRIAWEGLRDNGKTLGVALAVYGILVIFQNFRSFRGYAALAGGGALLTLLRGDGALLGVILLAFGGMAEWGNSRRVPWRTPLAALGLLLIISPQLWYNLDMTGYPVPECRHAQLLRRCGVPALTTPKTEVP